MTTLYQLLAATMAVLHLVVAFYLLTLFFTIFLKRVPAWYILIQTCIVGIAGIFHITSGVCPLTFGEKYFSVLGGEKAYVGSFLNHYAERFFNVSLSDPFIAKSIMVLAVLLVLVIAKKIRSVKNVETARAI